LVCGIHPPCLVGKISHASRFTTTRNTGLRRSICCAVEVHLTPETACLAVDARGDESASRRLM
jgi:hypothetical protein